MFLYIDPGTGSMLFSIIIGIVATLFFSVRALALRLKVVFASKDAKARTEGSGKKYPIVIYNEGKQYCMVFKPVLEELESRSCGIGVQYLTSFDEDPALSAGYKNISCQYIGKGNKAFAYLNLLSADVVLMTTPGLDVYQLKRSKAVKHYSHILHAANDVAMYRLFGLDYFDSVLLTGDAQRRDLLDVEASRDVARKEIVTVGCTYLDYQMKRLQDIPQDCSEAFTVLFSPTWGPSGLLSKYGERLLDPLVHTGFHVIVRPHPQSLLVEKQMIDSLMSRYEGKSNVEWDTSSDNLQSLSKADIMISDFSGIIYDYAFMFDRPVLYSKDKVDLRIYDAGTLSHDPIGFDVLPMIGVELVENQFESIGDVITKACCDSHLGEQRRKAKDMLWQHRGESGKLVADFLIEKFNEIEGAK